MVNFRRKTSRRPKGKRAVIRKALRTHWKKSVAKVAKRVMERAIETKSQLNSLEVTPGNRLQTDLTMVNRNVFVLTPNPASYTIQQSVGESGRVGNVITVKKMTAKIIIYPRLYSAASNPSDSARPTHVTFWCVSPKNKYLSPESMANLFKTQFFNNGNSSQGYQSQLYDNLLPINTDVVTCHFKRTYKLARSNYVDQTATAAIAPFPDAAQYANNDFKMSHIINFDFTKFMPKRIPFNDNSDIPFCKTLYLLVGVAKADGTAYVSGSNYPVQMSVNFDIQYKDA